MKTETLREDTEARAVNKLLGQEHINPHTITTKAASANQDTTGISERQNVFQTLQQHRLQQPQTQPQLHKPYLQLLHLPQLQR